MLLHLLCSPCPNWLQAPPGRSGHEERKTWIPRPNALCQMARRKNNNFRRRKEKNIRRRHHVMRAHFFFICPARLLLWELIRFGAKSFFRRCFLRSEISMWPSFYTFAVIDKSNQDFLVLTTWTTGWKIHQKSTRMKQTVSFFNLFLFSYSLGKKSCF